MTTVIRGTDNSVSAPAITGTDSDTGVYFPAANQMALATNGTQAVFIDSSQNVGIGTSSPAQKLDVSGNIKLSGDVVSASNPILYSYNGSSVGTVNAGIQLVGSDPSIRFSTGNAEKVRIDSSGYLLVGTTSATPNPGFAIYPAGGFSAGNSAGATGFEFATFRRSATQIGSITQNGTTAVAYNTSSDYRLKENIQPMQNALAVVQQLNPVTYTWKADGSDGQGFIAHELQKVVPDCVTGEKDAVDADGNPVYQGIDTSFLVATLTAAIQEQQKMIEALQAKVAALEAKG